LGCFKVVLSMLAIVFDLNVEVFNHVSEVGAKVINVIILQFYFFGDTFSEGSDIAEHLTAFLHSDV
jgi:hypothetical protein